MKKIYLLFLVSFFNFNFLSAQSRYIFKTYFSDISLNGVQGITADKDGNLYVSSYNSIYKFSNSGHLSLKFDKTPSYTTPNPLFPKSKPINTTLGTYETFDKLTVGADGTIYILSFGDECNVQQYSSSGNFTKSFSIGIGGPNGFNDARDIALDKFENIWVLTTAGLKQFSKNGGLIKTLNNTSGIPIKGELVFDAENNFWTAYGNTVSKFNINGELLFSFGEKGTGKGKFDFLFGIDLDPAGNIYVCEGVGGIGSIYSNKNFLIQKFNPSGQFISSIGTTGTIREKGEMSNVIGLTVDKSGNVFAIDYAAPGIFKYNSKFNIINGTVFFDENKNCIFDSSEKPLPGILISVQPGNFYGFTDSNGKYNIATDSGTFNITQVFSQLHIKLGIVPVCPLTPYKVQFNDFGDTTKNKDFADQVNACPYLEVNINSNRKRNCSVSSTDVSYSNSGFTKAENVKVYVKMPKYVLLKKVDKAYTVDKDGNYIFNIGTLEVNQSGTIQLSDSVVCQPNITGLTACTKAWITPVNHCTLPKSTWDKSDIFLSGKCIDNGFVRIVLKNTGEGNMTDSSQFRVFIDAILAFKKGIKINKGDSLVLKISVNGKTVRLEADQRLDHPRKSQTSITFEGCTANIADVVSRGFVNQLPQDDTEPEVSIQCLPILTSFDPNDKQVLPAGTTSNHYTPTDAELKYQIRFQNTGTDTTFTAVVIDTLSDNLDISTLQVGAASHKYLFNISGKGRPVLTWTFNNINLPDSTHDKLNSNGFVSFSIKAKAGLAPQSKIENYADIIFDFNDPVLTNTTLNKMYDVPLVINNSVKLDEKVIIPIPIITSFFPLKAKVGETIMIKGKNFEKNITDNILKINDLPAVILSASDSVLVMKVPSSAVTGKFNLKTNYGITQSNSEFIVLYPPVISSFSPEKGIPGDKITISGNNFDVIANNNSVKFGDISAQIVSANAIILEVKVPPGFYQAKIAVTTPVGNAISTSDFTMLLTATENLPENNFSLYPNPTDGKIIIDFGKQPVKVFEISVLNSIGSPIYLKNIHQSITTQEIDLSEKGIGMYLILIKTDKGTLTRKVILK